MSFNIKVGGIYSNLYALKSKTLLFPEIETYMNCFLHNVAGEARMDIMFVDV